MREVVSSAVFSHPVFRNWPSNGTRNGSAAALSKCREIKFLHNEVRICFTHSSVLSIIDPKGTLIHWQIKGSWVKVGLNENLINSEYWPEVIGETAAHFNDSNVTVMPLYRILIGFICQRRTIKSISRIFNEKYFETDQYYNFYIIYSSTYKVIVLKNTVFMSFFVLLSPSILKKQTRLFLSTLCNGY